MCQLILPINYTPIFILDKTKEVRQYIANLQYKLSLRTIRKEESSQITESLKILLKPWVQQVLFFTQKKKWGRISQQGRGQSNDRLGSHLSSIGPCKYPITQTKQQKQSPLPTSITGVLYENILDYGQGLISLFPLYFLELVTFPYHNLFP